jgi:precorrin-6B methylase 2
MEDRAGTAEQSGIDRIRGFVGQTSAATVKLSALGLALRARMTATALDPIVQDAVGGVLEQCGLAEAVAKADPDEFASVLALIRAELLFGGHILESGVGDRGWQDRSADVMQAFGEVSLGFWRGLERFSKVAAPDLLERLDKPGARFLDVGTGVGWLSVGMLQRWPKLTAVGVEPLPGALALARANFEKAGLINRIELRLGVGQAITDQAAFDLVFVPSAFIPGDAIPTILNRARQAIRSGGRVLLAVVEPPPEDATATALAWFRTAVWGGDVLGLAGGRALLKDAGFTKIEATRQPGGFVAFLLGQ